YIIASFRILTVFASSRFSTYDFAAQVGRNQFNFTILFMFADNRHHLTALITSQFLLTQLMKFFNLF
ncbi:hypothetical protein, partial [Limosilactobacillus mucosae]|uniref:hypothetical protein n=1 Tax=Limosilactobacillus mucosae TaxID=97478 RepID=UPI0039967F34